MPDQNDYFEPSISGLRKRLLEKQLARVRETSSSIKQLQLAERTRGLSSVEVELNRQYESQVRAAELRLRSLLEETERQDAAIRQSNREIKRLTPLQRAASRAGLYRRSEQDRIAAIAGLLQRERRQNAPLTREAEARAKAIAAASRRSSGEASRSSHVHQQGYLVRPGEVAGQDQFFDPCIELIRRQRNRREVFFALGLAGRGYRAGKRRQVC